MDKFSLYILTNLVTGKWYVGKTNQSFRRRWTQHRSAAKRNDPRPLYKSMRKYGPRSFHAQIITTVATLEEINNLERLWIILLRSHERNYGYNLTYGGEGEPANEELRKRRSEYNKAHGIRPPSLRGSTLPDYWRKSLSLSHMGQKAWNKGIPTRESSKEKLRKAKTGIKVGPYKSRIPLPMDVVSRLYLQDGLSCDAIARLYGVRGKTIWFRLKEKGVPIRPAGARPGNQNSRKSKCQILTA